MKIQKRIIVCLLSLAMVISSLYIGKPVEVMAAGTYVIRVDGTDDYLYAGIRSRTSVGALEEGNNAFYWLLVKKSDGSYWIQNRDTAGYMCLENQKGTTGTVDLLAQNYEEWQSGRWQLSINEATTIKNKWKGNDGYISVSDTSVSFGSSAQKFVFEEKKPNLPEYDEPNQTGGVSDGVVIPEENSDINSIGAKMPYTRYESQSAMLGGGAVLAKSKDFSKSNIASQASEQSYVRLPKKGSYAEWTMQTTGNGVTMRFTMPDSSDGMGLNGSLDVYVNGAKVKTINLTSYYMWQYFSGSSLQDTPGSGKIGCFAFDETHFMLPKSLKVGDKIRIQSSGAKGLEYGVDFIEVEETGAAIAKPENALSITDYGAKPDDGVSDLNAINNCINAAKSQKKDVYIPAGTFEIGSMWRINASDIKITGAGIWYTNIKFTSSARGGGGISGSNADNVEFCNMYINSNLRSRYGENAIYKCFMDVWSGGSYIHDIWEEHFECGFWIADYAGEIDYSDGLKITNSRIRNNFADGVNFCQGTSNAVVYNCDVRNNGDDGLAMWNTSGTVKDEYNNTFCYNTIEFIWRAGAIAIYGGNRHKIYNNYIADTFLSSGIHLNTVFSGYKFLNNDDGINFSNNIIVRSGSVADVFGNDFGAIDVMEGVRNIIFNNTYIYDSQHDAVEISGAPTDIVFNNINVYGTGYAGQTTLRSNKGVAFKFAGKNVSQPVTINGFHYAGIKNDNAVFGNRKDCIITDEKNEGSDYQYSIPIGTKQVINFTETRVPEEPVTTKQQPTKPQPTKPQPTKAKVTKPKKAKVTKIATKKKSSKKIKITLKKISGAKGYQVAVYKTKKNAKKNKKAVYKKFVKKYKKVTLSSKKLKNKKTLYVKARAYKLNGKTKVYGSWSSPKKVKIKK